MAHIKKGFLEGTVYIRCPNCGHKGKGKHIVPGSAFMEILLYFFFLLPGIIYTRRRSKNSGYICSECRNQNVVKIDKLDALKPDMGSASERFEALEKLASLKEKGIITEIEFELKKKELIG